MTNIHAGSQPTPGFPSTARGARDRLPLRTIVTDDLREMVRSGRFPPGAKLPPEPILAETMGVSRGTLREAVRALEQEGILRRQHGTGTFVTEAPSLRNNLSVNSGVTQLIESMGMRAGTTEMTVREDRAGPDISPTLHIPDDARVIIVDRLRTADGRPIVHSIDIFPRAVYEGPLEHVYQVRSMYEFLHERCGQTIDYGIARIKPATADSQLARRLHVKPGTLLLLLEQVDYNAQDRPVLLSIEYHLASTVDFSVYRRGPGAPGRRRE